MEKMQMEVMVNSCVSIKGKQIVLGNDLIEMRWTRFRNNYIAYAGGGIYYLNDKERIKISELAEGSYIITDTEGKEHQFYPQEIAHSEINNEEGGEVALKNTKAMVNGLTWSIEEKWEIAPSDNKLHWRIEFTPPQKIEGKHLVSANFNVLPGQWRTMTLASYCGFFGNTTYAIFPKRENSFWMRLEEPKIARNVYYPFTYKPTKVVNNAQAVVLEGYFLIDQIGSQELAVYLRDYLKPVVDELPRILEDVMKSAFEQLQKNFEASAKTGYFAEDEGAFYDVVTGEKYLYQNIQATFGAGFSCGFSGHAIIPLLTYWDLTKNDKAKEMAKKVANWIVRYVQTPYGGYQNVVDMSSNEGFDFIGEDVIYPHTTAKIATNVLKAYEFFKEKEYRDSALKACEWLLSVQEENGAIPWKLVASTGELDGTKAYSITASLVICVWIGAYNLTKDDKYIKASEKLAGWVISEFIEKRKYGAYITDDHPGDGFNRWEVPSSPSPSFAVEGLLEFYKLTKKEKYLKAAEEAGYFASLWQWLWEPPQGCLSIKIKGTSQAAKIWSYTISQTLGNELVYVIEGYLRLYEITKKDFWLNTLRLAISRIPDYQYDDPEKLNYGSVLEGWDLNKDRNCSVITNPHGCLSGTNYLLFLIPGILRVLGEELK